MKRQIRSDQGFIFNIVYNPWSDLQIIFITFCIIRSDNVSKGIFGIFNILFNFGVKKSIIC